MKILTVIYHETAKHYNMGINALRALQELGQVTAVVNRAYGQDYPQDVTYLQNTENCLAKAWNKGLHKLFQSTDYVLVSGLDSLPPTTEQVSEMLEYLKVNHGAGLAAATGDTQSLTNTTNSNANWQNVKHGDSSFSFFILSKEAFQTVGNFDERYKPAYFEDNDYLERLWEAGFTPMRAEHIRYWHIFQGTVKHGEKTKQNYPKFMQRNLDLFKQTYNKVPDHLPQDVTFSN